jgi:hypothetical protein
MATRLQGRAGALGTDEFCPVTRSRHDASDWTLSVVSKSAKRNFA